MSSQARQYRQLTLGQRYQIQALLGKGHMQKEIAESVGTSPSALSRELGRNSSDKDLNQYFPIITALSGCGREK